MLPIIIIKTIGEIVDGSCCFDMITMVCMYGWMVCIYAFMNKYDRYS